jgi:DNA-binding response OmpR family regulator
MNSDSSHEIENSANIDYSSRQSHSKATSHSDSQPLRILVIEDHADIAENIGDYLEQYGFVIDYAMDGIGGLHLAITNDYDVIVLDIMLPGMDGITLCKKLRQEAYNRTPIIMLTARDTLPNKLEGFSAGTDDYLVKPFELEELHARIKALHCRNQGTTGPIFTVEDIEVNLGNMMVNRAGRTIELTPTGMNILVCLVKAYPNLVTRKELEFEIWGDTPPDSNALKSHMYTLRNKIDKGFDLQLIHTIHGVGYRIGTQSESQDKAHDRNQDAEK